MPINIEKVKKAFMFRNKITQDLIEVGDLTADEFRPHVKLNRWGGECHFKLHFDDTAVAGAKTVTVENDRIQWKTQDFEFHYYEAEPRTVYVDDPTGNHMPHPQNEQGGVEFEIILKQKPSTNSFTFNIDTENLKWYYQGDGLHPDHPTWVDSNNDGEVDGWKPENVIGSYAAFHETRAPCYLDDEEAAKKYKTCLAFYIYRPKATDANGKEAWCKLHLDEQEGTLTVTIPQDFLDAANYPVTIDPTLGTTSIGGASVTIEDSIKSSLFTTPNYPNVTSIPTSYINMYVAVGNTAKNMRMAIYRHSDLVYLGTTAEWSQGVGTAWTGDKAISVSLAVDTEYLLAGWCYATTNTGVIYYAAGAANQGHVDAETYGAPANNWPNPMVVDSHNTNNYSIYVMFSTGKKVSQPLPYVDKLTREHVKIASRTMKERPVYVDRIVGKTITTIQARQIKDPLPFVEKLTRVRAGMYSILLKQPLPYVDKLARIRVGMYSILLKQPLPFVDKLAKATALTYSRSLKDTIPYVDKLSRLELTFYIITSKDPMPYIDKPAPVRVGMYSRLLKDPLPFVEKLAPVRVGMYSILLKQPLPFVDKLAKAAVLVHSRLLKNPMPYIGRLTRTGALTYSRALKDVLPFVDRLTAEGQFNYARQLKDVVTLMDSLSKIEQTMHVQTLKEAQILTETLSKITAGTYSRLLKEVLLGMDVLAKSATYGEAVAMIKLVYVKIQTRGIV